MASLEQGMQDPEEASARLCTHTHTHTLQDDEVKASSVSFPSFHPNPTQPPLGLFFLWSAILEEFQINMLSTMYLVPSYVPTSHYQSF